VEEPNANAMMIGAISFAVASFRKTQLPAE
jgi:hypothetical protein